MIASNVGQAQRCWKFFAIAGLLFGVCMQVHGCDLQKCKAGVVCGADGLTYQNHCFAECAGVEIADATGPCKGGSAAHQDLARMMQSLASASESQTINLAAATNSEAPGDGPGRNWLFQDDLTDDDVFRFSSLGLRLVGRQPPVRGFSFEELETLPTRKSRPGQNNTNAPTPGNGTLNPNPNGDDGSTGFLLVQRLTSQGALYAAVLPHDALQPGATSAGTKTDYSGRKLRNIIERDDLISTVRPYQPPYRYVGQINFKGPDDTVGWCSGGLIGPYTVLTAGHCVYHLPDTDNRDAYLYPIMYFYPGRRFLYAQNKTSNAYGVIPVTHKSVLKYYSNSAYMAADEQSIMWDVGLLELERPLNYGFFDLAMYDTSLCNNLTVTGYPGHKQTRYAGSQWHTSCMACPENTVEDSNLMAVDCDWTPGISGAPMYVQSGKKFTVVAVATGEYMAGSTYYPLNIATTITSYIYTGIVKYMYVT